MILVTGGAGFIGSALVWALNQRGYTDILIVDNLGSGEKWKNLRGRKFADYCEKTDFLPRLERGHFDQKKITAIFHLGACSSTTESDCSYLIRNNFEFSKSLALYAHARQARFIYASSAATYGNGENGFDDDESKLERLMPLNMYGYSKHIFDLWLKNQGLLKKSVGLKFFNVFGPNEYHKGAMSSFVLKAFEQIKNTATVQLFKSYRPDYRDGEQLRDFIYVKDAVEMTLHFLEKPELNGLFNIATGVARNWNDLVKATFNAMGVKPSITYIDMPDSIRNQYQYFTKGNIEKLRASGYNKKLYSLEEAIDDYVKNYLITGARLA